MLKSLGLSIAALLLSLGSIGASAAPTLGSRVAASQVGIDFVYYYGGRCFSRCVSGRIVRRCSSVEAEARESCCSSACNQVNNHYNDYNWYYNDQYYNYNRHYYSDRYYNERYYYRGW
jgi:hypothetical protein